MIFPLFLSLYFRFEIRTYNQMQATLIEIVAHTDREHDFKESLDKFNTLGLC